MSPHSKAGDSPHDSMTLLIVRKRKDPKFVIHLTSATHQSLTFFCCSQDLCWVLANTFSIFFFTLDVILLAWIKFTYFSEVASWCATGKGRVPAFPVSTVNFPMMPDDKLLWWFYIVIMIPVLFGVLFFGISFYRKLVQHQYLLSDRKYQELEEMKRQLDPPIITVWEHSKSIVTVEVVLLQFSQGISSQHPFRFNTIGFVRNFALVRMQLISPLDSTL